MIFLNVSGFLEPAEDAMEQVIRFNKSELNTASHFELERLTKYNQLLADLHNLRREFINNGF